MRYVRFANGNEEKARMKGSIIEEHMMTTQEIPAMYKYTALTSYSPATEGIGAPKRP
jgi:nitrate reductase beta subunit